MIKLKYFPLQLFLFLFLIDKIFLIPAVRKQVVQNYVNSYDLLNQYNDKLYAEYLKVNALKKSKSETDIQSETIMFFGTSRSAGYAELTDNFYKDNPFIKDKNISKIPVTSWSIKAAPFIHVFQIYNHYIKKYPKPKLIVLEINHASFNKNNVFKEKKDIYDFTLDQFFENHREFSLADKIEYISNLVFVLNKSKINFKNIFKTNTDANVNETLEFILNAKKLLDISSKENLTWEAGEREGKESEGMKKGNILNNNFVLTSFYQSYKTDITAFNLFKKILRDAKEKKIPLILYRPKTHILLKKETEFIREKEKIWVKEIHQLAKESEVLFLDFEDEIPLKCDYFSDTSHMSKTCFPEIIEKIIESTKQ